MAPKGRDDTIAFGPKVKKNYNMVIQAKKEYIRFHRFGQILK